MFENIMAAIDNCPEEVVDCVCHLLHYNGVLQCPISFGDPYYIYNLCVTRASKFSFGEVVKGDHLQIHHRKLLQSIDLLHASNKAFSQKMMD